MAKFKYITEFEINASTKMIYPYLSTPSGLGEWFAENVILLENEDGKVFDIVWDGISHPARITAQRTNQHVKYLFLPEKPEDEGDPAYLEFKLSHSDMTETSFLKIIDYSDMVDEEELRELWHNLVEALKELIGA